MMPLLALLAVSTTSPAYFCVTYGCPIPITAPAERLQGAWNSGATTDAQRMEISRRIEASMRGGQIDWSAAANSYFDWRKSVVGEPPAIAANGRSVVSQEDAWERLRPIAEAAVRARLIDPTSAEFSWPYGFFDGEWKPILRARVRGQITCGQVNSRNRLGGYVGASPFVVVLNNDVVTYLEISQNSELDFTAAACQKSAAMLPIWQHTAKPSPPTGATTASIAEELTKLAELRSKGLLSEQEFDAAKAKVLGSAR